MLFDGIPKKSLCILNVFRNFGKISQLQRCPISFYDIHEVDTVEVQLIVFYFKFFGGKVKSLLDQIDIFIHLKLGK